MEKSNGFIEGFKAVEFMRQERDQISNEIQGMNFIELQKYFEERRRAVQYEFVPMQETNCMMV
jgi:hypothetical protein